MPQLNVVIADDHPIVLLGVRQVVQRSGHYNVIAEAVSSSELIEQLQQHRPNILITDFNMPGDAIYGDGFKLVEYILRHFPLTQVLVLTMISSTLILARLHELGVAGVIQKNQLHDEIDKALEALKKRQRYVSLMPAPVSVVRASVELQARFHRLSVKELEVLRLFVAGMTVGDIARQLSRSNKTVSAQKVSAMRKLQVESDQDLLTYCLEANLFK